MKPVMICKSCGFIEELVPELEELKGQDCCGNHAVDFGVALTVGEAMQLVANASQAGEALVHTAKSLLGALETLKELENA